VNCNKIKIHLSVHNFLSQNPQKIREQPDHLWHHFKSPWFTQKHPHEFNFEFQSRLLTFRSEKKVSRWLVNVSLLIWKRRRNQKHLKKLFFWTKFICVRTRLKFIVKWGEKNIFESERVDSVENMKVRKILMKRRGNVWWYKGFAGFEFLKGVKRKNIHQTFVIFVRKFS
jgi:hypothetical protein